MRSFVSVVNSVWIGLLFGKAWGLFCKQRAGAAWAASRAVGPSWAGLPFSFFNLIFYFSFQMNSLLFCYYCYNISAVPKIMKIILSALWYLYYLIKILTFVSKQNICMRKICTLIKNGRFWDFCRIYFKSKNHENFCGAVSHDKLSVELIWEFSDILRLLEIFIVI